MRQMCIIDSYDILSIICLRTLRSPLHALHKNRPPRSFVSHYPGVAGPAVVEVL